MRSLLVLIALYLFSGNVFSQSEVTIGMPYTVVDAPQKYYIARRGEVLTVKINDDALTVQKINARTQQLMQSRSYMDFPAKYTFEGVYDLRHHYYVFYSVWEVENKIRRLYARELDFAGGSFTGSGTQLISVTSPMYGTRALNDYKTEYIDRYFEFGFSYDSSAMVITYQLAPKKRSDGYDIIGMNVFDPRLGKKWGQEVKMPYLEERTDGVSYSVDAEHNVYALAKLLEQSKYKFTRVGKANYSLELVRISTGVGGVMSTKVSLANKFILSMVLQEASNGKMQVGGFYNRGANSTSADGVVLFDIRADGQLSEARTHEILVEILNQYERGDARRQNERKDTKGKAELEYLTLTEMVAQSDGGMLLIGEVRESAANPLYSGPGSASKTLYRYDDMLVTRLDAAGKLMWMKKLPKRQQGTRLQGGMSYRYIAGIDAHYFLFLDNEKNINLPLTKIPAMHADGSGGFLTAYKVVDRGGELKKISILNVRDVQGDALSQFHPSRMLGIGENTLVFEAYKKQKEDVLIKVALE